MQNPVRLDDDGEPQPDFLLLRPPPDDYRSRTPGPLDVLLLIKVAQSGLRYDRHVNLLLYAGHGIPEVWIVDLVANVVATFSRPSASHTATGRFTRGATLTPTLTPTLLPGVTIPVTAILG